MQGSDQKTTTGSLSRRSVRAARINSGIVFCLFGSPAAFRLESTASPVCLAEGRGRVARATEMGQPMLRCRCRSLVGKWGSGEEFARLALPCDLL